jgi:hypothetical protein
MPVFSIEVESEAEIEVREFVDQCTTEELKELVEYLVELKLINSK